MKQSNKDRMKISINSTIPEINFSKKEIEEAEKKNGILQLNLFTKAKCNAKCDICYTSDLIKNRDAESELRLEETLNIIVQAKKIGAKAVFIAGAGEPFLDDNLLGIVHYCKEQGLDLIIFTNGICLENDETLINKIEKYDNLRFICKWWSVNSETNNELIGVKNAYKYDKEIINNNVVEIPCYIIRLMNHNIKIAIETVARPENFDELDRIIKFTEEKGIPLVLETVFCEGNACGKDISLTSDQNEKIQDHLINFCERTRYTISVDNYGGVYHCHAKNVGKKRKYNIRNDTLDNILQKVKETNCNCLRTKNIEIDQ